MQKRTPIPRSSRIVVVLVFAWLVCLCLATAPRKAGAAIPAAVVRRNTIQLRLDTSAERYRTADAIRVKLSVTNVSDSDYWVLQQPAWWLVDFRVTDERGRIVRASGIRNSMTFKRSWSFHLTPSETHSLPSLDSVWCLLSDWGYILTPGKYTLIAFPKIEAVHSEHGTVSEHIQTDPTVGSNSVVITILP